MQNPDKETCEIYVPDEGKIFVQVDQSGAEALVVAYLCRPARFRKLFQFGIKPHVFVALHLFKDVWKQECKLPIDNAVEMEPEDLVKQPWFKELDKLIKSSDGWSSERRYYFMAKQVCHSSNYDIKATEFSINVLKNSSGTIVLSKEQATTFLSKYHSLFPEIKEWHAKVRQQIKETKRLVNLFGFERQFNGFMSEQDYKQAFAWIPQSTVGVITHMALCDLQDYIEENGLDWDILNNKHDSYLVQCPVGQEKECAAVMQKFIERKLKAPDGTEFQMRSEASVGTNWKSMKSL